MQQAQRLTVATGCYSPVEIKGSYRASANGCSQMFYQHDPESRKKTRVPHNLVSALKSRQNRAVHAPFRIIGV